MRAKRGIVVVLAAATVLAVATEAAANGGASLTFDQTYYVAGDEGVASAYVRVPERHEDLFERGPFHLYAVPIERALRPGRPLPAGAIRLGTFSIEPETGRYFGLHAPFTAPAIDPATYGMWMCNDPCTVVGFGDQLSGSITIVATRREADLLVENGRLRDRLWSSRREVRRAERRLEAAEGDLETQLSFGSSQRAELAEEIDRLGSLLAAARSELAAARERSGSDPWVVAVIAALALVAAAAAFRRRRPAPIGRLEDRLEDHLRDDGVPAGASSTDRGSNGHRRSGVRIGARSR